MAVAPAENTQTSGTADNLLSARSALLTAAWIGLVGGYADLLLMFLRRKAQGIFYLQGREFPWTVPLAGLAFVMAPALLTVLANRIRPGLVTRPAAAWLFTTVALWGALLRLPLHTVASLVLAAGVGRRASRMALAAAARRPIAAKKAVVPVVPGHFSHGGSNDSPPSMVSSALRTSGGVSTGSLCTEPSTSSTLTYGVTCSSCADDCASTSGTSLCM